MTTIRHYTGVVSVYEEIPIDKERTGKETCLSCKHCVRKGTFRMYKATLYKCALYGEDEGFMLCRLGDMPLCERFEVKETD